MAKVGLLKLAENVGPAHVEPACAVEPPSDESLLQRVQAQDEAALGLLYDRHSGLLFTLALRIVGDRNLAEEVLQDTFWRCWTGADQYDLRRGRVAPWLMGVTRNRAIDVLRGRQHQARLREQEPLPPAGSTAEPRQADTTDALILKQVVAGALNDLSAAQRQMIELAYYGGLTQVEIAHSLGEPLGTVKSRTREGLDRLRGALRPLLETSADSGKGHD